MLAAAGMRPECYPSLTPFPSQFTWSGVRPAASPAAQGHYTDAPCRCGCGRARPARSSEQGDGRPTGLVSAGCRRSAAPSLPMGPASHRAPCRDLRHITRHKTLMQQTNMSDSFTFLPASQSAYIRHSPQITHITQSPSQELFTYTTGSNRADNEQFHFVQLSSTDIFNTNIFRKCCGVFLALFPFFPP